MERIVHPDNLREAFLRAVRGKACHQETQRFRLHIDDELARIADELLSGCYCFGSYRMFTVFDPKRRTICAAPFRDRVTMHAMMRVCHPVFEAYQVNDSYASRVGRGQYKALDRVRQLMPADGWFAKLDVQGFFGSIDHEVMSKQLHALFKDPLLLDYFDRLIRGYAVSDGRGLPIGNLTSQYFANHYLAVADHYLKEQLHARYAVRYMDDTLLLDTDRSRLGSLIRDYTSFVEEHLLLRLHPPVINRCRMGIPFLGYVLFPGRVHLSLRSRRRSRHRLAMISEAFIDNRLTEHDYHQRLTALYAFTAYADASPFRKAVAEEQGLLP